MRLIGLSSFIQDFGEILHKVPDFVSNAAIVGHGLIFTQIHMPTRGVLANGYSAMQRINLYTTVW